MYTLDPIATNKKNIAKSLSSNIVFQYVVDRLQDALLYFGKPQKIAGKAVKDPQTPSTTSQLQHNGQRVDAKNFTCKNESPCGMDTSSNVKAATSSLSTKNLESVTENQQTGTENLLKSTTADYSTDSQLNDYHYCSVSLSSQHKINIRNDSGIESSKSLTGRDPYSLLDSAIDVIAEQGSSDVEIAEIHSCIEGDVVLHEEYLGKAVGCDADTRKYEIVSLDVNTQDKEAVLNESDSHEEFNFVFDEKILTGGNKVMVVCNGCGKEGHKISVST